MAMWTQQCVLLDGHDGECLCEPCRAGLMWMEKIDPATTAEGNLVTHKWIKLGQGPEQWAFHSECRESAETGQISESSYSQETLVAQPEGSV